ncbi:MAG: hypothetical protein AzoDbin1_01920 [Azoarcus sp.]|nr:hypothetical protein [Azoarcus sp.]
MRPELKSLALSFALAVVAPQAIAATENGGNAPFDFSYRVAGAPELRPTLVFNDGRDTYIELDRDVTISVPGGANAFRQGPYYVVRGLQPEIVLRAKREHVAITFEPRVPITSAANVEAIETPVTAAVANAAPPIVPKDTFSKDKTAAQAAPAPKAEAPVAAPEKAVETVADATPACSPKVVQSEASVLVTFFGTNTELSDTAAATLLHEAQARDTALKEVRVRMPETIGETGLGRKRRDYLANLLVSAGIPRSLVHSQYGATYGGDTEIVFVNGTDKPCAKRPPVVRMRDGLLTVISHDADLADVLKAVSEQMGVPLRLEGESRTIPVAVAVAAERPSSALARVGSAIGDQAVIVLRDNELVLRFN